MSRPWLALALSFSLAACDGGADKECEPGSEPMPGCTLADCQLGRNECGGSVYACDNTGHVIDLGTCDRSTRDAGRDGGDECLPGVDPIPGCSFNACQSGHNECGGTIFFCDDSGHVAEGGVCEMFPPTVVDADMVFPDAAFPDAAVEIADAGAP
jgi:hypothetical protein